MNLNDLAVSIHAGNKARGFWDEERNVGEALMLVVTELSEALEAHRSGKSCSKGDRIAYFESDDMVQAFKNNIKDTFEDELADAIIRILDLCGGLDIDIEFHVRSKLMYNATRPYKHGKSY
jgi:NTP pyrophosphatase (non-canonical NTP hydrolase)